jgi:hypothetical protein
MKNKSFHRKFTISLHAPVAGYSRLIQDDEAARVHPLETYQHFYDSKIAERVLIRFSKMGYAILPLHDSFIIHHGLKDELQEAMDTSFYEETGARCKVKRGEL